MTIGLVGNARYGGGGVDTMAGLLVASGGLCDRLFDTFDLMTAAPVTCCAAAEAVAAAATTGTGALLLVVKC